eukprot:1056574-Amorphochlora_amoeboformis.AAC.1
MTGRKKQMRTLSEVPTLHGVRTLKIKKQCAWAILDNGRLFSWGYGPLGTKNNGNFQEQIPKPVIANYLGREKVLDVDSWDHSAVLCESGNIFTWGNGYSAMGYASGYNQPYRSGLNVKNRKKFYGIVCAYRATYCLEYIRGNLPHGVNLQDVEEEVEDVRI